MKMTMKERFLLLHLLPQKENMMTLRIIADLKSNLPPTEEEVREYDMRQEGNNILWDTEKDNLEKEIPIGEKAMDICIKALKDADNKRILTAEYFSLWEKFIKEV